VIRLSELAASLGAEAVGEDVAVTGAAEPAGAGPDQIALAMQPAFAERLGEGGARAAILWPDADWRAMGLAGAILAPRPRYVLAGVTRVFERAPEAAPGVHPSAVVDPSAEIGEGASIGAFVVIGARVRLGAGSSATSRSRRTRFWAPARSSIPGCGSGRGSGSATASSRSPAR
jgi:UDP-3-O-[3-hydroxymyristoyl] glucosamine N-acyltransferase